MSTVLTRAERLLVDARRMLLEFGDELGQGQWDGRGPEAVMRIHAVDAELANATALLFQIDGRDGPPPPSIGIQ